MKNLLMPTMAIIIMLFYGCGSEKQTEKNQWTISSPDETLVVQISRTDSGTLVYDALDSESIVLEPSPLGLVFSETSFNNNLRVVSFETKTDLQESYTLLSGKKTDISVTYNELKLVVENGDEKKLTLNFRVFNDGFAFRYEVDNTVAETLTLTNELTGFNLPDEGKAWIHPYDTIADWAPAYETFYENGIDIGTKADPHKNGWAFPMLFHTGENWTLITEADLKRNFAGMHLEGEAPNGLYTMRLPEPNEARGLCDAEPTLNTPFEMPWRVVITSEHAAEVVESNLVTHVSEENKLKETAWIDPGISAWSWWSISQSPRDYNTLKQFVDFTAEMGWKYFLVDANWNEMEGGTLESLTQYAVTKDVGILVWYNSGGKHNVITEQPRSLMDVDSLRRKEFAKLQKWGAKGIKVDFFQSDKPCIINQYHDILEDAAEYEILVNFHGSTLPRGWRRTYPNLMTMESVKGAEVYKFGKEYPDYAATHNTILVFTRNVIGPMDYTPVTFSDVTYPHTTTNAHELALAVVFESGIQHFADNYESYRAQPDFVINYLKDVPVVWDETQLIAGYPGEYAVVARRKGDTWYLSGINGLDEKKSLSIPLDFLSEGNYVFNLIKDGTDSRSFANEVTEINAESTVSIDMLPQGGFAAVIAKK